MATNENPVSKAVGSIRATQLFLQHMFEAMHEFPDGEKRTEVMEWFMRTSMERTEDDGFTKEQIQDAIVPIMRAATLNAKETLEVNPNGIFSEKRFTALAIQYLFGMYRHIFGTKDFDHKSGEFKQMLAAARSNVSGSKKEIDELEQQLLIQLMSELPDDVRNFLLNKGE